MYFGNSFMLLPPIYNLVMAMLWCHPEKVELGVVKAVHYCTMRAKPWRFSGKEENMDRDDVKMLVKKWWDIYNNKSLDHNNQLLDHVAGGPYKQLSHHLAPQDWPCPVASLPHRLLCLV